MANIDMNKSSSSMLTVAHFRIIRTENLYSQGAGVITHTHITSAKPPFASFC